MRDIDVRCGREPIFLLYAPIGILADQHVDECSFRLGGSSDVARLATFVTAAGMSAGGHPKATLSRGATFSGEKVAMGDNGQQNVGSIGNDQRDAESTIGAERLVLTADEARRYLNVSETRIYQMLASGEIEAEQIGRTWFIPKDPFFRRFGNPAPASTTMVDHEPKAASSAVSASSPLAAASIAKRRGLVLGRDGSRQQLDPGVIKDDTFGCPVTSDTDPKAFKDIRAATLSLRAAARNFPITAKQLRHAIEDDDIRVQWRRGRPYLAPIWVAEFVYGTRARKTKRSRPQAGRDAR